METNPRIKSAKEEEWWGRERKSHAPSSSERPESRGIHTQGEEPTYPYRAPFRRRAYEVEEVARRNDIALERRDEEAAWEKIEEKT